MLLFKPYIILPLSSILYVLSLPPFSFSPLYFLSLLIVFYSFIHLKIIRHRSLFIFFLLNYLISISWISQSFSTGGGYYILLGYALVFVLSMFLAFLNTLTIKIIEIFFLNPTIKFFLIPLTLTVVSIIKEFLLGGFPWNPSSIIWIENYWILILIKFTGIYGLGIINHLLVGLLIFFLLRNKIIFSLTFIVIVILYLMQFINSNQVDLKNQNEKSLSISIIQPNLKDSLMKDSSLENLIIYEDMTREALENFPQTELIVWPEGSMSIDLNNKKGLLKRISLLLNDSQKLILGSTAIYKNKLYNRLYVINNLGEVEQFYDKQKLVLFGEYMPFQNVAISKFLNFGMSFSKGHLSKKLILPNNFIASPMICFESIFEPTRIHPNVCASDFIIQISNDSWFGSFYGPIQHFKNSILRSVEKDITLVRSTTSGVSAIVSAKGKILNSLSSNTKGYINYELAKSHAIKKCSPKIKYIIMLLILLYVSAYFYERYRK